ncbi:MAG: flagellin [Oligoflexia bacterium]|nr:flagellin [Oligoflexia bacterium]
MGLRIATNIPSIAAQRILNVNHDNLNRSLERLSSGMRINRAGDDAAGLAISEKLKANIRSMKQANRNANDGISLIQTAEGAMNEVGNILIRLRELSIQGASDTIGQVERGFIDKEVQGLKSEIDRIANSTEFNGRKLLSGVEQDLDLQVGIHNIPTEDRFTITTESLNSTLAKLGLANVSTMDKESSQRNLAELDAAIEHMNGNRSTLGAFQNRLQSTINNLGIYIENISAANSRIRDTDMAEETTELAKSNILSQANIAVLSQANQSPQMALKLLG